jgi:hypothetical protein
LLWCVLSAPWACVNVYLQLVDCDTGDSFRTMGKAKAKDIEMLGNRLAAWLTLMFGGKFTNGYGKLAIGSQEDTSSCGVSVISAMEHGAFAVPMFSHRSRNQFRIRYFVELATYALDDVSAFLGTCLPYAEVLPAGAGSTAGNRRRR